MNKLFPSHDPVERAKLLHRAAAERILIIDGAMGTMIQRHKLDEDGYRGTRFRDWPRDVKGNNDLLSLTQPEIIREIYEQYLAAGADIIETNTFNAQVISMADYGMEELSYEINVQGARLARQAADLYEAKTPGKPRFVAGAIGPTNRTASISPDVNNPGFRNTSFDELRAAYTEQTLALIEGGSDIILIETIFDTLNAKAAGVAVLEAFDIAGVTLPLMISGTITDRSGRTLSGQTPTAFWYSMRHLRPFSIGLNCALGADLMRPHIAEISGRFRPSFSARYVCSSPPGKKPVPNIAASRTSSGGSTGVNPRATSNSTAYRSTASCSSARSPNRK